MSWVENEFAFRAFSHMPKFRQIHNTRIFKINCRCPLCGDSKKDPNKARFWCFDGQAGGMMVHCYNCDESMSFAKYLKEKEPDLYREYLLELRREENKFRPEPVKQPEPEPVREFIEKLNFCERLDRLPKNHPVIKYVKNRCIPENRWNRLWFTMQWPALVNSVNPDTYKAEPDEPRLVIPIFNAEKKIESFQGRALRKDAGNFKYITIKAHEQATKVYGLDTVDKTKLVFVLEGPIDSLFVDNGIAITGGSLDLEQVPFKGNRAWIMDHEPRHPDTIKRMKRLIDAGETLVFWDRAPWSSKDINDMIKDDGATQSEIQSYIESNCCSGLMAQLRLKNYSKV